MVTLGLFWSSLVGFGLSLRVTLGLSWSDLVAFGLSWLVAVTRGLAVVVFVCLV